MKNVQAIADGSKVEFNGQIGHTTTYAKGWYDVSLENGEFTKARRKDLVVLPPDPPAETPASVEDSGTENTDQIEISCPNCEHVWTPKRLKLSIQCPKCGAWVQVRIKADLTHYIRGLGVTPSGHDTLDIGDSIADALRGLTADEAIHLTAGRLIRIGYTNMTRGFRKDYGSRGWRLDILVRYLADKYASRNNGMVRMNCGNLLRAASKRTGEI